MVRSRTLVLVLSALALLGSLTSPGASAQELARFVPPAAAPVCGDKASGFFHPVSYPMLPDTEGTQYAPDDDTLNALAEELFVDFDPGHAMCGNCCKQSGYSYALYSGGKCYCAKVQSCCTADATELSPNVACTFIAKGNSNCGI